MSPVDRYVGQALRQAPQWTQASSVSFTLRLRDASPRTPVLTSHARSPVPGGVGTFSFSFARSPGLAQNGLTDEVSPYENSVASVIEVTSLRPSAGPVLTRGSPSLPGSWVR